jgi:hypothetical protein
MLPLCAPPTGGLKLTLAIAFWPGERVTGMTRPLNVNPFPVTVAWETVKSDPPELLSVAVCVCVVPTGTLPKVMLLGVTVSWPGLTALPVAVKVVEALAIMVVAVVVVSSVIVPLDVPCA